MPASPPRSPGDLRALTPARVGLGRSGSALPTAALLDFTLDHARARDAVHAAFDTARLVASLGELGLETVQVASCAPDRRDYLRRPDLGRTLDPDSRARLAGRAHGPCDLALVIADGLSPTAVNRHAADVVARLLPLLQQSGIALNDVVVATGARVALGDEIGEILDARVVAVLVGERPGLSAPDSLGAYLTFAPKLGRTDAERNCVSNIHGSGLSSTEAAHKIAWLIRAALARQLTGVALKDESGEAISPQIAKPV
ncbi:ethanolamine ammonia-lyase subunit EutC [Bradyrhizobium sp.]|uniref:ethanolamine ammonia-lyase subunit EutC n=1 Tax=Bradyrhizobium sp. TaxID=376 RepID=UPI00403821E2